MFTMASIAHADRALLAVSTKFVDAITALKEDFFDISDHELTFSRSLTGKLHAQILQRAPFDGFLAADQQRPGLLREKRAWTEANRLCAPAVEGRGNDQRDKI